MTRFSSLQIRQWAGKLASKHSSSPKTASQSIKWVTSSLAIEQGFRAMSNCPTCSCPSRAVTRDKWCSRPAPMRKPSRRPVSSPVKNSTSQRRFLLANTNAIDRLKPQIGRALQKSLRRMAWTKFHQTTAFATRFTQCPFSRRKAITQKKRFSVLP